MEINGPLGFAGPRSVSFGRYRTSLLDLFMTSKANLIHWEAVEIRL